MAHYVNTGEARILDTEREVVGLHKNRYLYPIRLCVTKISGVGADSIFLGVMKPMPVSQWALSTLLFGSVCFCLHQPHACTFHSRPSFYHV